MNTLLVVGLGNPGKEYDLTRHNLGFWTVDQIADHHRVQWTYEKSFFAFIAKYRAADTTVYLLKPQTYMNRSGLAVASFAKYHKIPVESICVIHDELDLLPGQVKFKKGGGHAGHNGLRDIQQALSSANFMRFRVGIGHPRSLNLSQNVADFVLHPPNHSDKSNIDLAIDKVALALKSLIDGNPPPSTLA